MARERHKARVNFGDREAKRQFMLACGGLDGLYEVDLKPVKPHRSNNANAYYHAAVVEGFRLALLAQRQHFTHDQCHEYLRDRFIQGEPLVNADGEEIGRMPASSAPLDSGEFFEFVESCREWIYDTFNYLVEEPASYGLTSPPASAAMAGDPAFAGEAPGASEGMQQWERPRHAAPVRRALHR